MRKSIDPKDKRAMEKEIGQPVSEFLLRIIMHIDGDYSLNELQAMCKKEGLVISGNKRPLALRLLIKEISSLK